MCFVVRTDGTVLTATSFGAEQLGFSVDELVGRSLFGLFHSDDRAEIERQLARSASQPGVVERRELRTLRRDDSVLWVREAVRTVEGPDGEPVLLIACEDITDQRETQEQLERAKKELERCLVQTSELKDQSAFSEELLDAVPVPVFYTDRKGRLLGCNRAFEELAGARHGSLFGRRASEVMEPEPSRVVAELVALVGKRDEIAGRETTTRTVSGAKTDLEIQAGPFKDREGAVRGVIGTVFDVTERNRHAAALQASEARHRRLVEDQTEFVVRWLPDGTRTFVNEAYCRYFGGSKEDFLGTSFMPLVTPEFHEAVRRKIASLEPQNPVAIDEHQVVRPDGTVGWTEWTDRGQFDEDGKLVALQSVGRDITERKQAEESQRVSEKRYRELFEDAKDAIFLTTADGKWIDINPTGVELLGYDSREELMQTSISSDLYVNPEDRDRLKLALSAQGFVRDYELTLQRRNGERIVVLESSTVIRDEEGRIVGYRGILHDVTERRRLEEQLRKAQRMEAIGQLAGGIAHDFNNLLTVIMGNTSLLRARIDNETVRGGLDQIRGAADKAAALTKQLLAFGRRQVFFAKIVDLNAIVTDTQRMLKRLIGEDIEPITRLESELGKVRADPGQIEQVLLNMVINARDAMPRGGTLTISTSNVPPGSGPGEELSTPAGLVCLEVSDTGIGIPEENRDRVFEPFFTTKGDQRGTGLGMSTAYGIVKQSGGAIDLQSEVGRGTTFRVYLPRIEVMEGDPSPPTDTGEDDTPLPRQVSESLLLVEDEESVRGLLASTLRADGYRVLEAADGEKALSLLVGGAVRLDLIITDIVMPGISGFDLVDRLPESVGHPRVLFISGHSDHTLIRYRPAEKGQNLLQKPFAAEELSKRVRQLLDGGASGGSDQASA